MTIDLTKNTTAFGLMSEEEREALRALPKGEVELYCGRVHGEHLWLQVNNEPACEYRIYRHRPTPPLIVDPDLWRHLPKWANFITADDDGLLKYHRVSPQALSKASGWESSGKIGTFDHDWPSITFTDPERWEEAIVKRPEGV